MNEAQEMNRESNDQYKKTRFLYIIEAAVEYFITIATSTVYLAKLAVYIGMPDSLTGIISAFISLGAGFQLFALLLNKFRPVKRWVTPMVALSEILFSILYVIPLFNLSYLAKSAIFFVSILLAQLLRNLIFSPKFNWFMAMVDDNKRGIFTANKETVSLISGMVFSFGLGYLMDYFEESERPDTAYLFAGIGLFLITAWHALTLIFCQEKPAQNYERIPTRELVKKLWKNKNYLKVFPVAVVWNMAQMATISFCGTYQTNELAFTTTFASVVIIVSSLVRALLSRPMGRFADKYSFTKAMYVCFIIEAVGFGINVFTVPENGKWFFLIFYVLWSAGQAGISSGTFNLIYDFVEPELRTGAFALNQTVYGLSAFLLTLALSPLMELIQGKNNLIFGVRIYAQQIFSFLSFLLTVFLIVYILLVVNKLKKEQPNE